MTTCEPGVSGPHNWKIETADYEKYGPTSPGVCQNCGETKDFPNSIDYTTPKAKGNKVIFAANGEDTYATGVPSGKGGLNL